MQDWKTIADEPLVVPLANLNGTSREEILRQHMDAMEGLRTALGAMRNLAPHARDYPSSKDPGRTLDAANRQYRRWLDAITTVAVEVEQIALRLSPGR